MKKILITGGSGYIGGHTIPFLKSEGYEVFNYDLKVNPKYDIFNTKLLTEKMRGADVVYHLAAIPHPFEGDEAEYRKLNYQGSINVFESAVVAKVKKFIFASSGCAYGFWGGFAKPEKLPLTEDNYIPTIAEGQTLYGYFKHAFEQFLEANSEKNGIRSISLRLEGVNPNVVRPPATYIMFMPNKKPHQQSCKRWHLLGNCSIENYIQLLTKVIEVDLDSYHEVFSVENGMIHPDFDVQEIIRQDFPGIPSTVRGNESLISIEKARRLLGYDPQIPEGFFVSSSEKEASNSESRPSITRLGPLNTLKRVIKKILRPRSL